MEDELKYLQHQTMTDITHSKSIISNARNLIDHMNLGPRFSDELELISSTLQELLKRTSQTPQYLKSFFWVAKQVRMMATDLLHMCKENMPSV